MTNTASSPELGSEIVISAIADDFPQIDPNSLEYHDGKNLRYNVDYPYAPKLTMFRADLYGALGAAAEYFADLSILETMLVITNEERSMSNG